MLGPRWGNARWRWVLVFAGLALFVRLRRHLSRLLESKSEGSAGSIILATILWLVWRQRAALRECTDAPAALGIALVLAGLLLYVPARSQSIYLLEVIAQIPILLGGVWLTMGREGLRRLWFPIALIVSGANPRVVAGPGAAAAQGLGLGDCRYRCTCWVIRSRVMAS